MKTKFIALTAVITLFTFASQAQKKTTREKITFGIRGGVNFQNVNWENVHNREYDTKIKAGFHVGVNAEIPIGQGFYVQPGVLFTSKGAKVDESDERINLYYVEVPVNLLYKLELGKGKLLLGAGPYVAWGVAGNLKNGYDLDVEWEDDVAYSNYIADFYLKSFDAGANLLAGYEFNNKFSVQLNAQLGIANIHPRVVGGPAHEGKFRNNGFGVSIGYRF